MVSQSVRTRPIPEKQPLLLEHQTDLARIVAGDLSRIGIRTLSASSLITVRRAIYARCVSLPMRDREAVPRLTCSITLDVGASIADVHDAIARNAEANSQRIDRGDLAVAAGTWMIDSTSPVSSLSRSARR